MAEKTKQRKKPAASEYDRRKSSSIGKELENSLAGEFKLELSSILPLRSQKGKEKGHLNQDSDKGSAFKLLWLQSYRTVSESMKGIHFLFDVQNLQSQSATTK